VCRVVEDFVIGAYPGHAVFVDGEEQGVFAGRPVVDRPGRDVRTVAYRGDGEALIAAWATIGRLPTGCQASGAFAGPASAAPA
jgi:hypothetical protein